MATSLFEDDAHASEGVGRIIRVAYAMGGFALRDKASAASRGLGYGAGLWFPPRR